MDEQRRRMMKKLALLLMCLSLLGCASTKLDSLTHQEVYSKRISQSSREEIEREVGVAFSDYYDYFLDGDAYSGVSYNQYAFLFKNNILTNVVEYGEMEHIWRDGFTDKHDKLPYSDNLKKINERLSSLPSYAKKPEDEKGGGIDEAYISDGLAAVVMLAITSPLIPVVMYETWKRPDEEKIDWASEIVGHSYDDVIKKLGEPWFVRNYENGDKILEYKQQYFWIPRYIGIRGDQAIWVLHQSFELNDNS